MVIANRKLLKIAADDFCAVYVKNDGKYFAFHAAVSDAFVAGADWSLQQEQAACANAKLSALEQTSTPRRTPTEAAQPAQPPLEWPENTRFTVKIRRDGIEVPRPVRPEAEQIDGQTFYFSYGWKMEADESYPGEIAWIARDTAYPIEAPTWIASGDLVAIAQPVQPAALSQPGRDALDAARYRWLRNNGTASVTLALSADDDGNTNAVCWQQIPEVLDTAIDAAIAKGEQP